MSAERKVSWDQAVSAPKQAPQIKLSAVRKALKPFLSEAWQKLNKAYQRDSKYSPMARISTSQQALGMYRDWCEGRQLDPLNPQHAGVYFGTSGACVDTSGPAAGSPYQAQKLLGRDLATVKKIDLQYAKDIAELTETYYFHAYLRSEKGEGGFRYSRGRRWEGRIKVRIWVPTLELQPPEAVLTKGIGWYAGCGDSIGSSEIKLRARNVWVPLRALITAAVRVAGEDSLKREHDLDQRLVIESAFKRKPLAKAAKKRRKRQRYY